MANEFSLRWNDHHSAVVSALDLLMQNETCVDVMLASEGQFIKAHRVVLCACSNYFQRLLSEQTEKHAIIFLKDVPFTQLRALVDYMYRGEVNIMQDQLSAFLQTAESLKIKGLGDRKWAHSKPLESLIDKARLARLTSRDPVPAPRTRTPARSHSPVQTKSPIQTDPLPVISDIVSVRSLDMGSTNSRNEMTSSLSADSDNTQETSQTSTQLVPNEVPPNIPNRNCASDRQEDPFHSTSEVDAHSLTADSDDEFVALSPKVEGLDSDHWMAEDAGDNGWNDSVAWSLSHCEIEHSTASDNAVEEGTPCENAAGSSVSMSRSSAKKRSRIKTEAGGTDDNSNVAMKQRSTSAACNIQLGPFNCPQCDRSYTRKNNLNRHIRFECGVAPMFACQFCPYRANHHWDLVSHIRRKHDRNYLVVITP